MVMREVLIILLFLLESSDYQFRDRITHPKKITVSFPGNIQRLLNILQGGKDSAKHSLRALHLTH
jgi:hypothetical protein